METHDTVQETGIKTIPKEKKCKKAKWLSEEALHSCKEKRSERQRRKGKILNAEFQKNIYFCFIDYMKAFDCVDHNKLWKILKEMGIPDHFSCLLRKLYADQEATVRTGHGTTDWFQIRKGVLQGCILSPCLFNLYEEYIMQKARLDEAQAGIKIAARNISNLRYTPPLWQKVRRN